MEPLPEDSGEKLNLKKLEEFVLHFRFPILITLVGIILIGLGAFFVKTSTGPQKSGIEVLQSTTDNQDAEITVEVAGEVVSPGVYKFLNGARVDDALVLAGGLSSGADRSWVDKSLNRAAKLFDGQKIYIPNSEETQNLSNQSDVLSANTGGVDQSVSSTFLAQDNGLTNINQASFDELDKLPGIGPVYGQRIIDQRPYSNVEELLSRDILPKSTFEKIKDKISVY